MSTNNTHKPIVLASETHGMHLSPVLVGGVRVYVECPEWCEGHEGDSPTFLQDLSHYSEQIALRGPREGAEWLMLADLRADAFGTDTDPRVVVNAGGDVVDMRPAQALKWADQVTAFADKIRGLARIAGEGQA
ncbi:DUF6907 domain-containing protein [Streptomyces albus]|uniref:DUF6907 domain-containing protein n=1 Tax=Streptomyces sp. NRRL F-5917 TaxID=1463873 RepID=UPI0004C0594A|nr:hypothetical protein [Streptomyces sp. NRRL F-5917]